MATAEQVEESLRSLIASLASASPEPGSLPDRTIACIVSDHDTAYRAQLRNAKLSGFKRVRGEPEADVRITASSDDVIALVGGKLNVAMAVLTGRVRVDASSSDLMMLRRLL